MSIWKLSYVACNCCGDPAEACTDTDEARAWARRHGWTRVAGNDLCPRCTEHPEPGEHCRPELFARSTV